MTHFTNNLTKLRFEISVYFSCHVINLASFLSRTFVEYYINKFQKYGGNYFVKTITAEFHLGKKQCYIAINYVYIKKYLYVYRRRIGEMINADT